MFCGSYGHVGDCNLHLNVSVPRGTPPILHHLEPFLFEWTAARGGSISAEHGVGQCKRDYMGLQRPPEVMAVLEQVQRRDSGCASLFRLTDAVPLWLCVRVTDEAPIRPAWHPEPLQRRCRARLMAACKEAVRRVALCRLDVVSDFRNEHVRTGSSKSLPHRPHGEAHHAHRHHTQADENGLVRDVFVPFPQFLSATSHAHG